jgi:hypothetical protein
LAFGTDKKDCFAFFGKGEDKLSSCRESGLRFGQIDDMDTVSFLVNKLGSFGMPPLGLMAKMTFA